MTFSASMSNRLGQTLCQSKCDSVFGTKQCTYYDLSGRKFKTSTAHCVLLVVRDDGSGNERYFARQDLSAASFWKPVTSRVFLLLQKYLQTKREEYLCEAQKLRGV
jgi:hypothetical protein